METIRWRFQKFVESCNENAVRKSPCWRAKKISSYRKGINFSRIWERKRFDGWNVCWNWRIPRVMTSFTDFTWNVARFKENSCRGKWSRGYEISRFIVRLLASPVNARQIKNWDLGQFYTTIFPHTVRRVRKYPCIDRYRAWHVSLSIDWFPTGIE